MHGHIMCLTDNYVIQIILGMRSQIPAQLLGVIILEAAAFFWRDGLQNPSEELVQVRGKIQARPITFSARRKIYISIQFGKPTM